MLLNELQQEYEKKQIEWKYAVVSSLPVVSKFKDLSVLLHSIVDVIESGFIEGIDLLLHFYDFLLHWNGKCEGRLLILS